MAEQDSGLVRWIRVLVAVGFLLLFFGVAGYTLWSGDLGTGSTSSDAGPSGVEAPQVGANETGDVDGGTPMDDNQSDGMAGEGDETAVNGTANETGEEPGDADGASDVGGDGSELGNDSDGGDDGTAESGADGDANDTDRENSDDTDTASGDDGDPATDDGADDGTGATDGEGNGTDETADGSGQLVTGCEPIDAPGTYELSQQLEDEEGFDVPLGNDYSRSVCIAIQSSDVVLEGNGQLIDGTGESGSVGVHVYDPDGSAVENVTVQNVRVEDWSNGVQVGVDSYAVNPAGPAAARLENVDSNGNEHHGFFITGRGSELSSVGANGNGASGIGIFESTGLSVMDATVSNNQDDGVSLFEGVFDSTFSGLESTGNGNAGIFAGALASGNEFSDLTVTDNGGSDFEGFDGSENEFDDPSVLQNTGPESDGTTDQNGSGDGPNAGDGSNTSDAAGDPQTDENATETEEPGETDDGASDDVENDSVDDEGNPEQADQNESGTNQSDDTTTGENGTATDGSDGEDTDEADSDSDDADEGDDEESDDATEAGESDDGGGDSDTALNESEMESPESEDGDADSEPNASDDAEDESESDDDEEAEEETEDEADAETEDDDSDDENSDDESDEESEQEVESEDDAGNQTSILG